jgi:hypothetical protein
MKGIEVVEHERFTSSTVFAICSIALRAPLASKRTNLQRRVSNWSGLRTAFEFIRGPQDLSYRHLDLPRQVIKPVEGVFDIRHSDQFLQV